MTTEKITDRQRLHKGGILAITLLLWPPVGAALWTTGILVSLLEDWAASGASSGNLLDTLVLSFGYALMVIPVSFFLGGPISLVAALVLVVRSKVRISYLDVVIAVGAAFLITAGPALVIVPDALSFIGWMGPVSLASALLLRFLFSDVAEGLRR